MKQKTYRFRRYIAVAIDWNLAGLPTLILTALLIPLVKKGLHPLLLLPGIALFPILFLNRDRLFRGRSPGNRLMKLTVLDRRTLQPLTGKALMTRNLFYLLGGIDLLTLIFTGSTLGDKAVAALVVHVDEIPEEPPRRVPPDKKTVLKTIVAVVLCLTAFIGMIFLALETVKNEPQYALAQAYLLKSETFALLEADPDHIRFTGYSASTSYSDGEKETEAVFTFRVKGHTLTVTCHDEGSGWYVCQECTNFR